MPQLYTIISGGSNNLSDVRLRTLHQTGCCSVQEEGDLLPRRLAAETFTEQQGEVRGQQVGPTICRILLSTFFNG